MIEARMTVISGLVLLILSACVFDKGGVPVECTGMADGTTCGASTDPCNPTFCQQGHCVETPIEPGMPCGQTGDNECVVQRTCDAAGDCIPEYSPLGTPCGEPGTSDCAPIDACDGSGHCVTSLVEDGAECSDCLADEEYCDGCLDGVCQSLPCEDNSCLYDDDCEAGNTNNTCIDLDHDDNIGVGCVGAETDGVVEAGVPEDTDFSDWQVDGALIPAIFYCSKTLRVTRSGVLTDAELRSRPQPGIDAIAQIAVIRCGRENMQGVLKDCMTVGISNATLLGDQVDIHPIDLAGSQQLLGPPSDPLGIVVQPNDVLCAYASGVRLRLDCDGSSAPSNCAVAPRQHIQYIDDPIDSSEPFDLQDSEFDGVLMIKATGIADPVEGHCSDQVPIPMPN